MISPWSDERIARVKQLWADNLSASAIGEIMGVTKNSVIGILHRQKLPKRAKQPPSARVRRPTPPTRYFRPAPQPKAKPMPMEPAVKPEARMLSLLDLQAHECKWPIGDPRHDGFGFCGAKADNDRPYCRYHGTVAYRPVEVRVR